jgi:hypothetical protein
MTHNIHAPNDPSNRQALQLCLFLGLSLMLYLMVSHEFRILAHAIESHITTPRQSADQSP